tara:strand:+ start:4409 stop:5284 length:876 start_codon:yes stop_codon:yes gene_type:complete
MPHRIKPGQIDRIPFAASQILNVDKALLNFIENDLNISVTTSEGFKKVPVIWSGAERAYQTKKDQLVRDESGALILPLITIERTGVAKDLSKKGTIQANIMPIKDEKGGSIQIARRLKQDKTAVFANTNSLKKRKRINFPIANKKKVFETITIPLPIYLTVEYEIKIRTEYQQQMNEIITPFITRPGGVNYVIIKDGEHHRYEAFLKPDYELSNNISSFSNEERKFETTITIEVLGYIVGAGPNADQPDLVKRENIVKVAIPRERRVLQDELEGKDRRLVGKTNVLYDPFI